MVGLIQHLEKITIIYIFLVLAGCASTTSSHSSAQSQSSKLSTSDIEEEILDEVTDDNIKRKEMWINIVTIFNKWESIQKNKNNSDKDLPVTGLGGKSDFCKEKFGYNWDTVRLAVELHREDIDLFNKIDNDGWGVRKAYAEYKDQGKRTKGRKTTKSTQSIDFIDREKKKMRANMMKKYGSYDAYEKAMLGDL